MSNPFFKGKTTVAASIAFGFVHQCRSISKHNKVLATAFSNVGADNLAEQLIRVGLKVVRVGKASAVSSHLWDYTLDAAIAKDPDAQKALIEASKATANIRALKVNQNGAKGSSARKKVDVSSARNRRELATTAVKASIEVRFQLLFLFCFFKCNYCIKCCYSILRHVTVQQRKPCVKQT